MGSGQSHKMESPKTTEEYIAIKLKVFDQMQDWLKSGGWTLFHEADNVILECTPMEGSAINAQKGQVILQGSKFEQFTQKLFKPSFDERKKLYPEVESEEIIKNIDEDSFILHTKVKAPFPLYPREFVVLKARKMLDDGSQLITAYSIEDPEIPVTHGYVRGTIQTGLIAKKLLDDKVQLTKVEHIDPCGLIPSSVVQEKQMQNAHRFSTMQAYLE